MALNKDILKLECYNIIKNAFFSYDCIHTISMYKPQRYLTCSQEDSNIIFFS